MAGIVVFGRDTLPHTGVPAGQGRARGHRSHGCQARHAGFVPNRVTPACFGSKQTCAMQKLMSAKCQERTLGLPTSKIDRLRHCGALTLPHTAFLLA